MPSPRLRSRRVELRPTEPHGAGGLDAVLDEAKLRGDPGLDVFREGVGDADVLAWFTAVDIQRETPVGLCALVTEDSERGVAEIAVLIDADKAQAGMGVEAYVLFVGYVFAERPVDKVCFWSTAKQVGMVSVNSTFVSGEVHSPRGGPAGSRRKAAAFAIEREVWKRQGERFLDWIAPDRQDS